MKSQDVVNALSALAHDSRLAAYRLLVQAGVREGRSIRCRADYARMNALLAFLTENCCGSAAAACAPACAPNPRRKH